MFLSILSINVQYITMTTMAYRTDSYTFYHLNEMCISKEKSGDVNLVKQKLSSDIFHAMKH